MNQGWVQALVTQQVDGTALTNTTTPTSIIAPHAKITLPPGFCQIGTKFRVKASGRISTAASTPGNLTLDVRFGSVIVATSQAMALATSQTNDTWDLEWDLTVRAIGQSTSANIMHTAKIITAGLTTSPTLIPATAPAVGTGFDSTAAQTVDFFATFSAASASNSVQTHQYDFMSLN
jgi:hypothetical protein